MSEQERLVEKQALLQKVVDDHQEWSIREKEAVLEHSLITGMCVDAAKWVVWSVWWTHDYLPGSYYFEEKTFKLDYSDIDSEWYIVPWYQKSSGETGELVGGRIHLRFYGGKLRDWSFHPSRY